MRRDFVIACIGCTEVVGDAVGPIVGDILIEKRLPTFVYGTTENPITSKNIEEFKLSIRKNHPHSKIIAVDACLGRLHEVGSIKMLKGGVAPGKALNAEAVKFGDIGVLSVVGEITENPLQELLTRNEAFVRRMAEKTAEIVFNFVRLRSLFPKGGNLPLQGRLRAFQRAPERSL